VVIVFHAFPRALTGGFVGVDVFFVISGYLISQIILRRLDTRDFSFREFYARRVARIFPSLVVVLATVVALGWYTGVMLGYEFQQTGRHVVASSAFVANEIFRREIGYFDTAAELKPLLHLWSLGVEEQFYLLWPATLWLAARRGKQFAVIVATLMLSFALNLHAVTREPADAFYSTAVRLWELALGALVAWLALRGRLRSPLPPDAQSWIGIGLIAAACVGVGSGDPFPGWRALLPTIGAAMVIASGETAWLNRRVLSLRPIVYVGLISYPLYLWHWPLLSFARLQQGGEEPPITTIIGAVVIAVALSVATYHVVERPIRFGRTLRWRTPALVSAMLVVAVAGGLAARGRIPRRNDRQLLLSVDWNRYVAFYRAGQCLVEQQLRPSLPAECESAEYRDTTRTSVLLWGDSHAAHLYPGFATIAAERNLGLAQHTMNLCTPVIDATPVECAAFTRQVLDRISTTRPDVVVMASRWRKDLDELGKTIEELERRGVSRIVIVGPVPRWKIFLSRILVRSQLAGQGTPQRLVDVDSSQFTIEQQLRSALGGRRVSYISALEHMCTAEGCLTNIGGIPTAWDNTHLTEPASRSLALRIID
jgi:peptidoglycan/LPS O-acetylase OafA/YrhL